MQDVVADDNLERFRQGNMKLHHDDKRSSLSSTQRSIVMKQTLATLTGLRGELVWGLFLNMVLSPFQLFLIFWLQKKTFFMAPGSWTIQKKCLNRNQDKSKSLKNAAQHNNFWKGSLPFGTKTFDRHNVSSMLNGLEQRWDENSSTDNSSTDFSSTNN